jgi:tetratricopeptide (TPR) repeat protein
VITYEQAGEIDRRRTVLKILGDLSTYVVTPASVRAKLSRAGGLLEHVRRYYQQGTLLLVGFRYGDPDLAALLDRVFGSMEPPEGGALQHTMIASGVGPVTVDELRAEHHIELINLPGRGSDDTALAAVIEVLGELADRCVKAGISLADERPDLDDLEGWLELLAEDPSDPEATAGVKGIENRARLAEDWERLIEVLMAQVEIESAGDRRAALLRQVAEVFEERIGDLPRAFTALTAAVVEDPADTTAVTEAERLADAADGWTELVGDISGIAEQIEDRELAAEYWTRLGSWYHNKLDHLDYALTSYRQAVKLDPDRRRAHAGLVAIYRIQQRWAELADALAAEAELEPTVDRRRKLYLELGEIQENQLGSVSRAVEAYEQAAELATETDDALAALERIYRREERWGKLARVLERRADLFEQLGETGRANAAQSELATLRAEKLGDLEGAIARYEGALDGDATNLEALRALEELYEKTGRTPDVIRTLERLSAAVPEGERAAVLRRLAALLEQRPEHRRQAVDTYRRLLEIEPGSAADHASLAALLRAGERWDELAEAIEAHATAVPEPDVRAELCGELGRLHEEGTEDLDRAIEAHLRALELAPERVESLEALARLYLRTGAAGRAAEALVEHARLAGDAGAPQWAEAGRVVATELGDLESAERHLEKALELDGGHLPALRALADLHERRGAWASAIGRLAAAAERSANRLEKVELYARAAELAKRQLEEPERALSLAIAALELDPDHRQAGLLAASELLAAGRDEEAAPVLEMLARTTPETDRSEQARWHVELGRLASRLGQRERATRHFRRAVESDVTGVEAAVGLAGALRAEVLEQPTGEGWAALERSCRDLLARHRTLLPDGQLAETWYWIGRACRESGEIGKARDAFDRAREREPGHLATLEAIADLAAGAGDWRKVIEARRALADRAEGIEKAALLEQIGDVLAGELGDPARALAAFREAIEIVPDSHQLLHKTLDIYSEQKDWRRAVETCSAIAATAKAPARRAKYFYAAAVIGRDELGDHALAAEHFGRALEEDPGHPKAFASLEGMLAEIGDHKNLARAYRKRLRQLAEDPEEGLRIWTRLGDLCSEHLGDNESAIAAYEVAVSMDPDNLERHEQLANLYLEAGEERRADAVAELQTLLAANPDRVELFRALSGLYRAEGDTDKAYCLAQAMVFLGAASENERDIYTHLRPGAFIPARRRLTEELWQKAIIHGRESRHVNVIFQQLVGSLAATTAQPPSAFHLETSQAAGDLPIARVLRYAAEVLGLEREPAVYLRPDIDGLKVANTALSGKLAPAVLIGGQPADADERELAFEVGKRLCYLRPDRYVNYALGSLPRIESAFSAALAASGIENVRHDEDIDRLATHLRSSVPDAVLQQVAAIAKKMSGDPRNGLIAGWRAATDLTANRVGLILCNDLEIAARMVATETGGLSGLPVKERLRDLLAYSVSESYFSVRRHLGLTVATAQA